MEALGFLLLWANQLSVVRRSGNKLRTYPPKHARIFAFATLSSWFDDRDGMEGLEAMLFV